MIILDTHAWIWWVDNHSRLRGEVRKLLDRETDVRISAISLLEIATAVSLNRLVLKPNTKEWLRAAQSLQQLQVEPITDEVCIESVSLPGIFHKDPADRLIVALARLRSAPLVTADRKILDYRGVETIPAE